MDGGCPGAAAVAVAVSTMTNADRRILGVPVEASESFERKVAVRHVVGVRRSRVRGSVGEEHAGDGREARVVWSGQGMR